MERIQGLKDIYENYVQDAQRVCREAKPMDGLFGLGDDPRKDPCHMRFYEAAERWVAAFRPADPEEAFGAVRLILEAAAEHREEPSFWFLYAAQGLARDLIPSLPAGHCARLRRFYDEAYPRRERMPVQRDVYRLLKKGEK